MSPPRVGVQQEQTLDGLVVVADRQRPWRLWVSLVASVVLVALLVAFWPHRPIPDAEMDVAAFDVASRPPVDVIEARMKEALERGAGQQTDVWMLNGVPDATTARQIVASTDVWLTDVFGRFGVPTPARRLALDKAGLTQTRPADEVTPELHRRMYLYEQALQVLSEEATARDPFEVPVGTKTRSPLTVAAAVIVLWALIFGVLAVVQVSLLLVLPPLALPITVRRDVLRIGDQGFEGVDIEEVRLDGNRLVVRCDGEDWVGPALRHPEATLDALAPAIDALLRTDAEREEERSSRRRGQADLAHLREVR